MNSIKFAETNMENRRLKTNESTTVLSKWEAKCPSNIPVQRPTRSLQCCHAVFSQAGRQECYSKSGMHTLTIVCDYLQLIDYWPNRFPFEKHNRERETKDNYEMKLVNVEMTVVIIRFIFQPKPDNGW